MIAVLTAFIEIVCQAEPLERWIYCSKNLWVDRNIEELDALFHHAAKAGYTHVLLTDSKFSKLGDMDERYFRNIAKVKKIAAETGLEIVPALFPIGYSNDLLWHDPNLIEGLPVRDVLLVVKNGRAELSSEVPVRFPGGDFADLSRWSWKDENVVSDQGAAKITNPKRTNARIVQKLKVQPFHQYHISVRIKTHEFHGVPEVKVLAGNQSLNFNPLGVKSTQDWQTHHVVFNSLDHEEINVYLGCWGGDAGDLWFDDAQIEEVCFLNLIRRDGAPLSVRLENGKALVEGKDFESLTDARMGNKPWKGAYDIYHEPPVMKASLPDGSHLRVSYYHVVTVYDDQAMVCLSEPKTMELLRDQARRMHEAWGARGYMMSHDEIRVLNWCAACEKRHLDAGAMLADNVKHCIRILRETNPGGRIYVWSDMFDPNHNAHKDYYLVKGDLAGSWEGLDKDVIIVPWYFDKRAESLKFFAERGHQQVIAGYYDSNPDKIGQWLESAKGLGGVRGVMYTTWQSQYRDLESFADAVNRFKNSEH